MGWHMLGVEHDQPMVRWSGLVDLVARKKLVTNKPGLYMLYHISLGFQNGEPKQPVHHYLNVAASKCEEPPLCTVWMRSFFAHLASTGPRPFLTCTSRIRQGSTVWQVDTWGMVLFWNNSNLQICKAMSLYIPPNWCRNRSSIEDCSLIWCDSIVRSSKKATPQTTSVAYLARAPECRKAFGSFHGHLMGMKNIRNRQPILHTGWSIWMALTYTFHWGASCSTHQLVIATQKNWLESSKLESYQPKSISLIIYSIYNILKQRVHTRGQKIAHLTYPLVN